MITVVQSVTFVHAITEMMEVVCQTGVRENAVLQSLECCVGLGDFANGHFGGGVILLSISL